MPGVVLIILTEGMRITFPFPRPMPGNNGRCQGMVVSLLAEEGANPSPAPHPIPGNKGRSQGMVANMMTYARKRGQAWQKQGSSLRRRR